MDHFAAFWLISNRADNMVKIDIVPYFKVKQLQTN